MELIVLPGKYTIHHLQPGQELPEISNGFFSVTCTDDEISVVCLDNLEINSDSRNSGWKCLKVTGPLKLDQVGILNGLSKPLKEAGISIFAISTFDTDYLLVPGNSYEMAVRVLSLSHSVIER